MYAGVDENFEGHITSVWLFTRGGDGNVNLNPALRFSTSSWAAMSLLSVSLDAFIVLATAILVPTALFFRRQPRLSRFTLQNALTLAVVLHSLYVLYTLLVRWPPNIFQRLKIPLTTPSESIRTILLQRAGLPQDVPLPRPLEMLLTRLSLPSLPHTAANRLLLITMTLSSTTTKHALQHLALRPVQVEHRAQTWNVRLEA